MCQKLEKVDILLLQGAYSLKPVEKLKSYIILTYKIKLIRTEKSCLKHVTIEYCKGLIFENLGYTFNHMDL